MRDLELEDRRLELPAESLVAGRAGRILDARLDVDDEPVEPLPGVLVADVEGVHLAPEGREQLVQGSGGGHREILSRSDVSIRLRRPCRSALATTASRRLAPRHVARDDRRLVALMEGEAPLAQGDV